MRSKRPMHEAFIQKELTDKILSVCKQVYHIVRQECPDEDEHFYLATTWFRKHFRDKRPYRQGEELSEAELGEVSWTETMQFAILEPPDSIRAMSLYIVHKECPREYLKYVNEYNRLMKPVKAAGDHEGFMEVYRLRNPKIVARSEQEES